jgi:multidrug resistance efflux pump
MPVKRKYNVRGTKDFIVLAGIFFFLCLWSIKDAWYPSSKVLKKHPREIAVAFETDGIVGKLHVAKGDPIIEEQVLAELRRVRMQEESDASVKAYSEAKGAYTRADESLRAAVKNSDSPESLAELKQSRIDAQAAMDSTLEQVNSLREKLDLTELRSPSTGSVMDVFVLTHSQVVAGDTVIMIDPKDHFYLFNKSLAIFSFIAFWVFLGIHVLAQ